MLDFGRGWDLHHVVVDVVVIELQQGEGPQQLMLSSLLGRPLRCPSS